MAMLDQIRKLRKGGGPGDGGEKAPRGPTTIDMEDIPFEQGPEDIEEVETVGTQTIEDVAEAQGPSLGDRWEGGGDYIYEMEEGGIRIVGAPKGQEGAEGFLITGGEGPFSGAYSSIMDEYASGQITPMEPETPVSDEFKESYASLDDIIRGASKKALAGPQQIAQNIRKDAKGME